MPPIHSYFSAPGDDEVRLQQAFASAADAVIIDWEDSVATENKAHARHLSSEVLAAHPQHTVLIRVNGAQTPAHAEDLQALEVLRRAHMLILPKVEGAESLALLHERSQKAIIALIESARGLLQLAAITQAKGLAGLALGATDLSRDLALGQGDGAHFLDQAAFQLRLYSSAQGLAAPIDAPYRPIDDLEGFRRHVLRRRAQGFGASVCLSAEQVAMAQALYAHQDAE